MENFTFYSPTYFVFGKEAENQTGSMVKRFGGNVVRSTILSEII